LNYTLIPYNLNPNDYNKNSFLLNYRKVANLLEKFNMKYHLLRIMNICMYQDVYAGLWYETQDSFDIIQINSDYIRISSKEDSVLIYSLDFNFFKTREYLLDTYGEEIKQMYLNYTGYTIEDTDGKKKKIKGDPKLQWQEPPNQICIKINDDQLLYSLPPFSGIFPEILNLEDYKLLKKAETQLKNYKILGMEIELDENGLFKLDEKIVEKFYTQACNNIADGVGIIVSPMKITKYDFQNNVSSDADAVNSAESSLWAAAGSSSQIFGGGDNPSSSSLNISIKNDQVITFSLLRQCENWLNKFIKKMNLPYDFKVSFLNQSIYDDFEISARFKEASVYGVAGAKSLYVASIGLSPSDVIGLTEIESVLDFTNMWIPLQSANTQSSDSGGRPTNKSKGKGLTDAGEQTKEDDENDSK
jgi:hypothetical protein